MIGKREKPDEIVSKLRQVEVPQGQSYAWVCRTARGAESAVVDRAEERARVLKKARGQKTCGAGRHKSMHPKAPV